MHISKAKIHDVNILDLIPLEIGSYYVMDKGYLDFGRLYKLHAQAQGSYFVTRAKDNTRFKRMCSRTVELFTGVQSDQIGKLELYYSKKDYPDKIRRIKYYDPEHQLHLVFLTSNKILIAQEIAMLYKKRWEVEIFFRWVNQHLKIKSFWSTTLNANRIKEKSGSHIGNRNI